MVAGEDSSLRECVGDGAGGRGQPPFQTVRTEARGRNQPLALLVWNIDRGEEREALLHEMKRRHPDLCLFQEVDFHARPRGFRYEAEDFARALGMNYFIRHRVSGVEP